MPRSIRDSPALMPPSFCVRSGCLAQSRERKAPEMRDRPGGQPRWASESAFPPVERRGAGAHAVARAQRAAWEALDQGLPARVSQRHGRAHARSGLLSQDGSSHSPLPTLLDPLKRERGHRQGACQESPRIDVPYSQALRNVVRHRGSREYGAAIDTVQIGRAALRRERPK